MRLQFFLVLFLAAAITAPAFAASDSIPLSAVNKASAVIDRAIEAHGGAQALSGIKTVTQRLEFKNFATNQSVRPGPPWDEADSENFNAVDFENRRIYTSNKGSGGGFLNDAATVIDGESSANIDYRAKTIRPLSQANFDAVAGPFVRITPTLLIRALMNRRHTSHWLGEAEVAGNKADIVTLVMEVGPALALYVDQKSGLLVQAERVLAPFGQVRYRYLDYAEIDGFAVNRGFELYANDQRNLIVKPEPIAFNAPVAGYFEHPKDFATVPALIPNPLTAAELAKGVHLIGGSGTYALFVETGDEVVAIGGTAGIPARIAELERRGVKKPIRYGVITHHHGDHVLGVEPYRALGAKIIGHEAHADVIRAAATDVIDLETVSERRRLGRGRNRVEIIDIGPTPHSEHILVAYLPRHKLLFQADHSGAPRSGPLGPAQPVTAALLDAVERLGLEVDGYLGAHSPRVISAEEFEASVREAGF